MGIVNPLMAAFIQVASESTFIVNSAGLLSAMTRIAAARPMREPVPSMLEATVDGTAGRPEDSKDGQGR
jgi:hypothetical protein